MYTGVKIPGKLNMSSRCTGPSTIYYILNEGNARGTNEIHNENVDWKDSNIHIVVKRSIKNTRN